MVSVFAFICIAQGFHFAIIFVLGKQIFLPSITSSINSYCSSTIRCTRTSVMRTGC